MRADRNSPSWTLKQNAESDYHHRYSEINVKPLSHADSALLVESLVEKSGLSTELPDAILEKVEGNPLFAEEVVRAFHESQSRGDAYSENGNSVDIPDNLQALLVSRIDRLEDHTRRALQLAALIGRSFYYRVLEMIADDELSIDTQLANLVRADMIREAARIPELEYIFRHQLTQAAAYQTILLRERREFHQRVGEAIEIIFHDRIDEMSVTLAQHFALADNPERALRYLIMAGDSAIRMYAHTEAVQHYTKALDIALGQETVEVDILRDLFRGRGRALEMLPDYDEALANYERLGAVADQLEAATLKLDALVYCATLYATQTPFQNSAKGEAFSLEALEIARTLEDPAAESKIYWIRMMALTFAGENPERARTFGEKSLEIAREHELHEQTAFTIGNLVMAYWGLDEIEPAQQLIREARGLWEKLHNLPMLVDTFSLATYTDIMLGNLDSALHTSTRMIEISRSIDNGWNLTAGTYFLGLVEFERGNYSNAVVALEEVRSLGETRGIHFMYLNAQGLLAHINALLGKTDYVRTMGDEVVERRREMPPLFLNFTLLHVIQAYLKVGELSNAERTSEKMNFGSESETGNGWAVVQCQLVAAEIALANSDADSTLELIDELLRRSANVGFKLVEAQAQFTRGRALQLRGDFDCAAVALLDAQDYMQTCGARTRLWATIWARSINARSLGEHDKAADLQTEALTILTQVADSIDSEDQREAFLNASELGRK